MHIGLGESVAIIGPSGAGKSTLLSILAGLDAPDEGSVTLAGVNLTELDAESAARWRAENLSFVFQSFHLLGELSAQENTQLPLDIQGRENSAERAAHWLTQVGLGERLHHYPGQLSGGEQQRVAIARAFVTEPKILFADEPTGNLDSQTGERIIQLLLGSCREQGTTLVLITHDNALAARCDRQLRLEEGQLLEVEL